MDDTAARHVNLAALAVILIGGAAALFVWRLFGGGSIKVAVALLIAAVVVMSVDASMNGPDATLKRASGLLDSLLGAMQSALSGLGETVSAVLVGAVRLVTLLIEALFRLVSGAMGAFGSNDAKQSPAPEPVREKPMVDVDMAKEQAQALAWAEEQALANLTAQAQAEGLAEAEAAAAMAQPQTWEVRTMQRPSINRIAPAMSNMVDVGSLVQDADGRTYEAQPDGSWAEVIVVRPEDEGMGVGIANPSVSAPIEARMGAFPGPSVSVLSLFGLK